MVAVWNFVISVIQFVVRAMKSIPVWQGDGVTVTLFEFNIALFILTVVTVATVSIVKVAPAMTYSKVQSEKRHAERSKKK